MVPLGTVEANDAEIELNSYMCLVRFAVECNYKDLKEKWNRNDFTSMLKVRLASLGLLYRVSASLLNISTCLYKSGQVGH